MDTLGEMSSRFAPNPPSPYSHPKQNRLLPTHLLTPINVVRLVLEQEFQPVMGGSHN